MYRLSSRQGQSEDEEMDPDVILETDIPLLKSTGRATRTPAMRQIDSPFFNYGGKRSRARSLKAHEHMPFLSLDVAPEFRDQMRARVKTDPNHSSHRFDLRKNGSKKSRPSNSRTGSRQMSSLLRPGSRAVTPTLKYVSPNAIPRKVNHNIKTPFKHDINKSGNTELRPPSPSEDLKERTALATFHISRLISQQQAPPRTAHSGRLLKGRLKPLKPVVKDGPTMHHCLGVNPKPPLSPTPYYQYTMEKSKTSLRTNKPNEDLPVLPVRPDSEAKSVHLTSAASSVCGDDEMLPITAPNDSPAEEDLGINDLITEGVTERSEEGQKSAEVPNMESNDNLENFSDQEELQDEFDIKVTFSTGDREKTPIVRGATPKHDRIVKISQDGAADSRRSSAKSVRFADSPDVLRQSSADVRNRDVTSTTEIQDHTVCASPSILKMPQSAEDNSITVSNNNTESVLNGINSAPDPVVSESEAVSHGNSDGDKPENENNNDLAMNESITDGSIANVEVDSSVRKSSVDGTTVRGRTNSLPGGDRIIRNSASGTVNVVLHNSTPAVESLDGSSLHGNQNHDNQLLVDDLNLLQAEVSSEATTVWSDSRDASNENDAEERNVISGALSTDTHIENDLNMIGRDDSNDDVNVDIESKDELQKTAPKKSSASGCRDQSDIAPGDPSKPDDDDDDDDDKDGLKSANKNGQGNGTVSVSQSRQASSTGSTSQNQGNRQHSGGKQNSESSQIKNDNMKLKNNNHAPRVVNKEKTLLRRPSSAKHGKKGRNDHEANIKSNDICKEGVKKLSSSVNKGDTKHRPSVSQAKIDNGSNRATAGIGTNGLDREKNKSDGKNTITKDAWVHTFEGVDIDTNIMGDNVPSTFEELNDVLSNMRVEIKRWISLDKLSDVSYAAPLKSPRSMDSLLDPQVQGIYLTDRFEDDPETNLALDLSDNDDGLCDDLESDTDRLAPRELDYSSFGAGNPDMLLFALRKRCLSGVCGQISLHLTQKSERIPSQHLLTMDSDRTVIAKLTHENLTTHTHKQNGADDNDSLVQDKNIPQNVTRRTEFFDCQKEIVLDRESDSGIGSEVASKSLSDVAETESVTTETIRTLEQKSDQCFLEFVCEQLPDVEKTKTSELQQSTPERPLTVVATTKELSRPKTAPKETKPIAPYPPLCFHINARPPEGHLYYFAYGTDMNPNRLSTYIKRTLDTRLWGLLFGFQLVFNKKGLDVDAGGFPNIEFNPYSSVEGCLYTITQAELDMIDRCVGYPEHFEHVMTPVWMVNCSDPDNYGVAQHCVPAITYIAQDKWIQKSDCSLLHHEYSLNQCLKSADLLTPLYQRHLLKMSQG